ncbi:NlpC/P60 family protein [Corynebacterium uropygiale]|uniref:NlpC/P60 family protein n=1 Tax=Corynebacterium uropygiale TaxID=1775911 RepID=A0A9X1U710_9CORY|nr:NlpC/P60 family protein [Corynebacterium uropygiale]MCF4006262.1 NlpC/P60 family protein [Corynebacterium uropygiale]
MVAGSISTGIARADDVDDLIAQMETVSREAGELNDQVLTLEDDIVRTQEDVDRSKGEVEDAVRKAQEAQALQKEQQAVVNRIAGARYRGAVIDPITNAISAENPQNAIDRAAYMGVLARQASEAYSSLDESTRAAAEAHSKAAASRAAQVLKLSDLEKKRRDLDVEKGKLDERINQIKAQVDGLDEGARRRWIERYHPVEGVNIEGLFGSESGLSAVKAAMSKQGSPYGWGAAGPDIFDCSGLMFWAFQQQGKSIPRTSQAQMAGGTHVEKSDLQPGDIVGFYPGATHVGMYIGNGQVVHASDYGIPVQVVPLDSMPYYGASRY